jgi:hypothetical protein
VVSTTLCANKPAQDQQASPEFSVFTVIGRDIMVCIKIQAGIVAEEFFPPSFELGKPAYQ